MTARAVIERLLRCLEHDQRCNFATLGMRCNCSAHDDVAAAHAEARDFLRKGSLDG